MLFLPLEVKSRSVAILETVTLAPFAPPPAGDGVGAGVVVGGTGVLVAAGRTVAVAMLTGVGVGAGVGIEPGWITRRIVVTIPATIRSPSVPITAHTHPGIPAR